MRSGCGGGGGGAGALDGLAPVPSTPVPAFCIASASSGDMQYMACATQKRRPSRRA
jgi:hypothetical protein